MDSQALTPDERKTLLDSAALDARGIIEHVAHVTFGEFKSTGDDFVLVTLANGSGVLLAPMEDEDRIRGAA